MSKVKILYTSALNSNGNLVTALNAEKGNVFTCPICKGQMNLRKSEREGPGSRRPHFAHKALSPNCTPEGLLHHSFKMMFADILKKCIENGWPFPFKKKCDYCGKEHCWDLLKRARDVKIEMDLGSCRPDIMLLNGNGNPYLAIEVVVSHSPEEEVLEYYRKNKIVLFQINLSTEADLNKICERASKPDVFTFCTNPRCSKCGFFMDKRLLAVWTSECYRCRSPMNIAITMKEKNLISGELPSEKTPKYFLEKEIQMAKANGVFIRKHYSKTMDCSYNACTCQRCGAFLGEHYMIDEIMNVVYAYQGGNKDVLKLIDIEYFCPRCE